MFCVATPPLSRACAGVHHKAELIRLMAPAALAVVEGGLVRCYQFDLPVEMECWVLLWLRSSTLNINQVRAKISQH